MASNAQILEYYTHIKSESDEAFIGVEQEWSRNINLYTDNYSFKDKIDWQTTVKDPIVDNLVTRFANFFSRTLISQDGKYFTAKHQIEKINWGWCKRSIRWSIKGSRLSKQI